MKFYMGKVLHAEDKISKNGKRYQLFYILVDEDVLPITNWKHDKVYDDSNVKILVQVKNNFKTKVGLNQIWQTTDRAIILKLCA